MGDQISFMYGVPEDYVDNNDYVDKVTGSNNSYLRERLVSQVMPLFYGDNLEGLILYVKRLEEYINTGR